MRLEQFLREKKVDVLVDKNLTDKRSVTAVIGNLEGLKSLGEAQAWLKHKLAVLDSPSPTQVYAKGSYKGMVFAEFKDTYERDMAVTLLRTAGLKNDGKQVWASQDRDPVDRAARNFCYGFEAAVQRALGGTKQSQHFRSCTIHFDRGWGIGVDSPRVQTCS